MGLNCLTRESESLQTSYKRARLSFGTEFVEVYFLQMSYKEKGQNLNVTPTKPDLFRKKEYKPEAEKDFNSFLCACMLGNMKVQR